ncbi:PP2C family protein-serine/threonine phosphatase [Lentzea sp. DG1S-22]|uniref:PP2C family protein-serine/threonine phosphatase n=1 Tax=Lentzea sp. DG1S-22 TaxID=3108822 RepID=UPI002E770842|nr:PP2C family protein-serine/threonine phosphatase [Lentzea sp. DG1S-22]WVH84267.1 PP2C family protein-serine/threonine phosphatase [Lentzea sp. DG1S-22]
MSSDQQASQRDEQRRALALAFGRTGLTLEQLWMRYFALGGAAGLVEVEAYLHGLMPLPALQGDMLAHAINEHLDEPTWPHRVPYTFPSPGNRPRTGPLASLVDLLDGMHQAPPEHLPAAAERAGRALGLRISIYLVDYEQHMLHPLPDPDDPGRVPLGVDASLPGRAFCTVQTLPGHQRLWVPLLDGVERLGVLEVTPPEGTDLHDPELHLRCRWLSALIGHLVTISTHYGDGLDAVRLRRQRSPAADLIWQLLPPLTAATGSFAVAGLVEPCYEVGGDAFDYALSPTTASLAIFDAVGHTLRSGFVAAAALAACRSNRRAGHGLFEQARTIDETVSGQIPDGAFATGVLAELDLESGRLRYLNAGHPPPLLLRSGKVVKRLTGGRRLPFGLGTGELAIAEETLQPGDWLVLHTDGITEARDTSGEQFGDTRLTDFLEREAAAGHPPPETARRLVKAVLAHQNGVLQDDASVVLARWLKSGELTL